MNTVTSLLGGAAFWSLIAGGIIIERLWLSRRKPAPEPAAPPAKPWTAPRAQAGPALTADEILYLVELAACYPADSRAGTRIAELLRSKVPEIPDVLAMRYAIAFMHIARTFRRNGGDPMSDFIHALGGAALELSRTERTDIPR